MIIRPQTALLLNRLKENPPQFIQVLCGPRQVGKTTAALYIQNQFEQPAIYTTADEADMGGAVWIDQQWEAARLQQKQSGEMVLLIIDEVQKIDDWSQSVKKNWDQDRRNEVPIQILLLGSSRLLLDQGLTESLMGRYEQTVMFQWSFPEVQEAFDATLDDYLWFGGYPGGYALINDEKRWTDYIKNSIIDATVNQDILMMEPVRKPKLLRQLFELGTTYSGQILSYNKMLGQLQQAGNTTTLAHYLDLLDSAGMISGLQKYFQADTRKKGSSPKLQLYDTGIMSARENSSRETIEMDPKRRGRWIETLVGAHLLKSARRGNISLYYWRHVNNEIDFVIERNQQLVGIEVKSTPSRPTKGMQAFKNKFSPQKVYMVGGEALPLEMFLSMDATELF
ncbi:MAG: ATP-binding protein [Bacteroidota bacterium]